MPGLADLFGAGDEDEEVTEGEGAEAPEPKEDQDAIINQIRSLLDKLQPSIDALG